VNKENGSSNLSGVFIYRRLLGYVRPYVGGFSIAAIAMILLAATEPAIALLMDPLINKGFVEWDRGAILLVIAAILGIYIIKGITNFISSYGVNWVGRSVVRDMRRDMFEHLLYAPSAYYDKSSSGKLLSVINYNADQVSQASSNAITIVITDSFKFIFLLGALFYKSWFLTLVFLVIGPFIVLLITQISKRFRLVSQRIQESVGDVTHAAEQGIQGYREIRIYAAQETEQKEFQRANNRNRQQMLKMEAIKALGISVLELIAATGLCAVIFLATHESLRGDMDAGKFTAFITALILLHHPIKRLLSVNAYIQRGIAAAQSIFEMIDYERERDTGTRAVERVNGDIDFKNVCFRYEMSSDDVLENIDLTIKSGQTAAFVGKSGSGKTTLVSLLTRLYDTTSGTISIDGMDIREFKLASLRQQVALVSQHVTLFNDTARNNIAFGELAEASEQEILQAAKAAHAMEFIDKLPDGLDTLVGEDGVLLSGGQRQRLAIARAFLKDAPILILDEATSALDSESERYVQDALQALLKNRTTLVIAHRLSTIEQADIIFVMEDGRIIESGNHHDLLVKGGAYASFYQLQSGKEFV
jgi:subfamily B ATP-binding cassette protein MsbA